MCLHRIHTPPYVPERVQFHICIKDFNLVYTAVPGSRPFRLLPIKPGADEDGILYPNSCAKRANDEVTGSSEHRTGRGRRFKQQRARRGDDGQCSSEADCPIAAASRFEQQRGRLSHCNASG